MPTREIFWNITRTGEVVLYTAAAAAVAILILGLRRRLRRILAGRENPLPWRPVRAALVRTAIVIATNRRILKNHPFGGTVHLLIMWGFIGLFIGTALIFLEYDLFRQLLGQKHGFLSGGFFLGFEFVLDTLGLLFLIGLTLALVRRFVIIRPQLQTAPVELILPGWLILIGLTGFVVEGLRLAAGGSGIFTRGLPRGLYVFPALVRTGTGSRANLAYRVLVAPPDSGPGLDRLSAPGAQGDPHPGRDGQSGPGPPRIQGKTGQARCRGGL